MTNFASFSNLNINSWEIILLLILIGGGFLLSLLFGRNRIFILLLGTYISFALLSVIPFNKLIPNIFDSEEDFVVSIVIFLVLIGLSYFLLSRSVLKTAIRKKGGKMMIQSAILSIFLLGAIISIIFSFFPKDLIAQFSDIVLIVFNASLTRALWLIIPLIFIGLFKKKVSTY